MTARMHIFDSDSPLVSKSDVQVLCNLRVVKAVPVVMMDTDYSHNAVTMFYGPRTCPKCLLRAKAGNNLRYRYGVVSGQDAIEELAQDDCAVFWAKGYKP